MGNSEYSIVSWYQSVYRGFANYYLMAHDVSWKVSKLKWVMTTSLLKTLAANGDRDPAGRSPGRSGGTS